MKLNTKRVMAGAPLLDGPLSLAVEVHMPIPGSWSKKKQRSARLGEISATVRPDWDNVAKLIADSLSKLVYDDDRLIVDATVAKRYSQRPHLVVKVEQLAEGRKRKVPIG